MMASRVKQEVEVIKIRDGPEILCIGDDGVTIGRHGPFTSDGLEEFTHDGVTIGSRHSDFIMGGELMASEFSS